MNRPWKIWLMFGLCSAVVLGVMGWVSWTALELDHAQGEAQAQAELEESVRLALWRMDSMLAPVIAQEGARPYFTYNAFHAAERPYANMFKPLEPGALLVPSPLLTPVTNVLLHFQFDPEGRLTSPQVPEGSQRTFAETRFTTPERIEAAAARLREFEQILAQEASPDLARLVTAGTGTQPAPAHESGVRERLNRDVLLAAPPAPGPRDNLWAAGTLPFLNVALEKRLQSPQKSAPDESASFKKQVERGEGELQARAQSVQQAFAVNRIATLANSGIQDPRNVVEGLFKPIWFGETLVFVRRVAVQGRDYVQGCWVDWRGVQKWLLEGVEDLLPTAKLEPLENNGDDPQTRMLATLPARVIPGTAEPPAGDVPSPIRFALALAWVCVLVAGAAVALLLQGTLSLSERRAAFVSAVTHELRTPLTTFKMYSEMLAGGMVPDEAKRRNYLSTLCAEASRLNHLVENVLAYARLERGSARSRTEKLTVRELMDRVKPRLIQRVEQAGMLLQEDLPASALGTLVQVDVSAVEQILFNLVDNACKYAMPSDADRIVHLEALPQNHKFALLRVRDHGQGISAEAARRLFRPFSKSANEAARTAPGVGLGLALCRRLGRNLGGDLRFNPSIPGGACFELLLPAP